MKGLDPSVGQILRSWKADTSHISYFIAWVSKSETEGACVKSDPDGIHDTKSWSFREGLRSYLEHDLRQFDRKSRWTSTASGRTSSTVSNVILMVRAVQIFPVPASWEDDCLADHLAVGAGRNLNGITAGTWCTAYKDIGVF